MRHKRGKKKHPLNDPARWDEDISPPFFDRQAYQSRVDQLVGLNRDGKSIVRLVWGPESIGLFGVPRYWLKRFKDGEGYRYVTVKRWYLEKRLEREVYFDAWNEARYSFMEPDGEEPTCQNCGSLAEPVDFIDDASAGNFSQRRCADCGAPREMKGKPVDRGEPPEDFFVFAWMCAEHEDFDEIAGWPKCCERANKDNHRRCYGEFRNPNDYDLECIAAGLRRREEGKFIDPYAPLTPQDLALIESASGAQTERMVRAIEERKQEILRDQRVLSERGGTFHDVGGSVQKTKSGLYLAH